MRHQMGEKYWMDNFSFTNIHTSVKVQYFMCCYMGSDFPRILDQAAIFIQQMKSALSFLVLYNEINICFTLT